MHSGWFFYTYNTYAKLADGLDGANVCVVRGDLQLEVVRAGLRLARQEVECVAARRGKC